MPSEATARTDRRRIRTVALALVVVAVSIALVLVAMSLQPPLTTVRVAAGLAFFDDPEVRGILRDEGILVRRTPVGSMSLTTRAEIEKYDAIVPGGKIAADTVITTLGGASSGQVVRYEAFFSPMVVVTYDRIIELLQRVEAAPRVKGAKPLVRKGSDGTWRLNMAAYLHEVGQKRLWKTVPGNTWYDNPNRMLITTTNPASSNSAAMFVAITSSAANGGLPVEDVDAADAAAAKIKACFTAQGDTSGSTPDFMDTLVVNGMNSVPMGLAYENDFIAARRDAQNDDSGLSLMYPEPTVSSANTMIAWTAGGRQLGEKLTTNEKLRTLLRKSGYRTTDTGPAEFKNLMKDEYGIEVSADLYTAPVPEASLLNRMIDALKP